MARIASMASAKMLRHEDPRVLANEGTGTDRSDLRAARRALAFAAAGIEALSASLDERFIAALDCFAAVPGRVIVTGMGKSGHVGRKIAATLASTGTPAFFVHPGEAGHGDLGMITGDDAVLAISNSGETPELAHVVSYCRRASIPLVAMTRNARSSLGEAADIVLLLPDSPEACPIGLAPTTSTSMTLALGDAIAMALLERKGFTAEHFHVFHPGGALGRKLRRVGDVMHGNGAMPLVDADQPMAEALRVMSEKRFGCVGVIDATGRLVGIFTDGDLRRKMSAELPEMRAGAAMTPDPITIRPQALVAEALAVMNARSILALFAVEEGRPVGILHIHDCLRAGADQSHV